MKELFFGIVELFLGIIELFPGVIEVFLEIKELFFGIVESSLGIVELFLGVIELFLEIKELFFGIVEVFLGVIEVFPKKKKRHHLYFKIVPFLVFMALRQTVISLCFTLSKLFPVLFSYSKIVVLHFSVILIIYDYPVFTGK